MQHLYPTKTMLGELKKIFPNRNRNFQEYLIESEYEVYNSTTRKSETAKQHRIINNEQYSKYVTLILTLKRRKFTRTDMKCIFHFLIATYMIG